MSKSNRFFTQNKSLPGLKTYHVGVIEAAAHRALRQHKDSLLKNYGITGVEWYIIGTVADAGATGIRTTDLAKQLGTTMGFLTKTVTLLEAKNFLHKRANAEDARSTYICFNEKQRRAVEEIEAALREKLRSSIYNLVTPEELLTYIKVMDKFSQIDN